MTERRSPTGRRHRRGRARTRVLDAIVAAGRPLSAEEVAALVPEVHVSSVYRALATLEEEGVVAHLHLGHGPSIYRLVTDVTADGHLVCEVCGHHDVVPEAMFAPLADALRERYGFVLDTSHFAVVGRCESCATSSAPIATEQP
ncbi:MAG TPA: transcriptional repressor [Acidimicrobiales bacterium]